MTAGVAIADVVRATPVVKQSLNIQSKKTIDLMPRDFRTFVAIELPSPIKVRIEKLIHRFQSFQQYRWTTEENLHLTLNFIGNVTQQDISPLCRAIESHIASTPGFAVQLEGCGAFPKIDRPRIVWLGVTEGSIQLQAIYSRIEQLLLEQKYPRDRHPFRPHITIGRLKREGRFPTEMKGAINAETKIEIGAFDVNEVTIYESVLEKSGPRYTPISRFKLA